jgi:hypothetical protein
MISAVPPHCGETTGSTQSSSTSPSYCSPVPQLLPPLLGYPRTTRAPGIGREYPARFSGCTRAEATHDDQRRLYRLGLMLPPKVRREKVERLILRCFRIYSSAGT